MYCCLSVICFYVDWIVLVCGLLTIIRNLCDYFVLLLLFGVIMVMLDFGVDCKLCKVVCCDFTILWIVFLALFTFRCFEGVCGLCNSLIWLVDLRLVWSLVFV